VSGATATAHPMRRQLLRFGIVGVANTIICLAILWTLRDGFGIAVWLASAVGYAITIVQSYLLNRSWTFAGGAAVPVGRQLPGFVAVNIGAGMVFAGLTSLLAPPLGVRLGSLVALVPVTVLSFLAQRRFVFARAA
jgi:putative flippase GtrA